MILAMPINGLVFNRPIEHAKMLGCWQDLLVLTDVLNGDVNPKELFPGWSLAIGTILVYVTVRDLSLNHHHLKIIINDQLTVGKRCR
jgi:hypothetical protein